MNYIRWTFLLSALSCSALIAVPLSAAMINEIRIDEPGTDNHEYFELSGSSGESLDGLTYLVLGDGAGGSGVIEGVVGLDGEAIPDDGYFLAAESTFGMAVAGFPGGSVDLETTLDFENSDNVTHFLVRDFTGALTDDLDTDDDGVLDSMPWSAIIDSVALVEADAGEFPYSSTVVGPDGVFVPGHIYRLPNNTGEWVIGSFGGPDFADTPGVANVPEPSTLILCGLGIIGVTIFRRGRS